MTISIKRCVRAAAMASVAALACGTSVGVAAEQTCVDLSRLSEGASLQGANTVAQGLEIQNLTGFGDIVKILDGGTLAAYGAGPASNLRNGGIATGGGFANVVRAQNNQVHEYAFSFVDGVSSFTLRMLDFGDWNPTNATNHRAVMTAYDASAVSVDSMELVYTTPAQGNPTSSDPYGPLFSNAEAAAGDALGGKEPGVWTWEVKSLSAAIEQIDLKFPVGMDPKIGFDTLCYVPFVKEVNINVHPTSDPNPLNLASGGTTPVAILGSADFDVTQINIATLGLGDAKVKVVGKSDRSLCSYEDVGSYDETAFDKLGYPDGITDLVCHFVTANITYTDDGEMVTVKVMGELNDGSSFEGTDVVKIVKY